MKHKKHKKNYIRLFPGFIILLFLILFPGQSASCAELSNAQAKSLQRLQQNLAVVKDLADHRIITEAEASTADSYYVEQSRPIVGRALTADEINSLATSADKVAGFGLFLNTIIVIAGFVLLLSVLGLVLFYLRDFLRSLPSQFYECAAYLVTCLLLMSGYLFPPFQIWVLTIQPIWFVAPGAFCFAASFFMSYKLHWQPILKEKAAQSKQNQASDPVFFGPGRVEFPTVLFASCTLVWGASAIFYHHQFPNHGIPHFLAFIAIMALQAFFGFSIITMPGCVAMGWTKASKIPRSTVASFILMLAYIGAKLSGDALPETMKLFESGCLFMGAFVYYLGLLIMSNKWYALEVSRDAAGKPVKSQNHSRYIFMQILTIISGLSAFYLGSSFHIGSLLGIGGTFFTLYLLEKYYEIPWKGVGWAWSLLGVAALMYFFVGFAGSHPQYFLWGMSVSR